MVAEETCEVCLCTQRQQPDDEQTACMRTERVFPARAGWLAGGLFAFAHGSWSSDAGGRGLDGRARAQGASAGVMRFPRYGHVMDATRAVFNWEPRVGVGVLALNGTAIVLCPSFPLLPLPPMASRRPPSRVRTTGASAMPPPSTIRPRSVLAKSDSSQRSTATLATTADHASEAGPSNIPKSGRESQMKNAQHADVETNIKVVIRCRRR